MTDRLADVIAPLIAAGETQADIARRIGVTRATVGDWIHRRATTPRADILFAAADALNVRARMDDLTPCLALHTVQPHPQQEARQEPDMGPIAAAVTQVIAEDDPASVDDWAWIIINRGPDGLERTAWTSIYAAEGPEMAEYVKARSQMKAVQIDPAMDRAFWARCETYVAEMEAR